MAAAAPAGRPVTLRPQMNVNQSQFALSKIDVKPLKQDITLGQASKVQESAGVHEEERKGPGIVFNTSEIIQAAGHVLLVQQTEEFLKAFVAKPLAGDSFEVIKEVDLKGLDHLDGAAKGLSDSEVAEAIAAGKITQVQE